jgi:hypothetical protein
MILQNPELVIDEQFSAFRTHFANREWANTQVPEGLLGIARRFNAGRGIADA